MDLLLGFWLFVNIFSVPVIGAISYSLIADVLLGQFSPFNRDRSIPNRTIHIQDLSGMPRLAVEGSRWNIWGAIFGLLLSVPDELYMSLDT